MEAMMNEKSQLSVHSSRASNSVLKSYVVMALSGLMGGLSLILFGVFLFAGLPAQIDLGLDESGILFINSLLCLLFFLQHSLMLRRGVRTWMSGLISPRYLSAFYSIFSGFFLFLLMLFWQKSTSVHLECDGALYWLMRMVFVLSMIVSFLTFRALKSFDPLGIQDISAHLKGKTSAGSMFIVKGTYQWIRHPVYFFSLLMIWTPVSLTTDRLLFNGLWTVWIIIGTILEERDLIAAFGDEYRHYQRKVPMLIPYKWFPWAQIEKTDI